MKTSNSLKLIRECPLNGSERRLLDPHFKEEERKDWLLIRKVIQPASVRWKTSFTLQKGIFCWGGQIVFRSGCLLGNHSPLCGCPAVTLGGIIVMLHLHTRNIQLPKERTLVT